VIASSPLRNSAALRPTLLTAVLDSSFFEDMDPAG
jgi:hypothetical protein